MSQAFNNNNNAFNNTFNTINYITPDDKSEILAWLSPLEPWIRHRDIGAQRVDSIGDWLLGTKEFTLWRNGGRENESNHATLFCEGNPGVGKSYICSLVIDKLCDEAVKDDTAVTCFYFDFAARNEQSPTNMLGSLLRQLVSGSGVIPEAVIRGFREQQKVIGGRRLQVSGIIGMFQTITATKRTFMCVDALDECALDHRMIVLESLGEILRRSPNTRIFMTGRRHVRSEVERRLDEAATFMSTQPTEENFIRYIREKLRNDATLDTMNPALEAAILKSIPEISGETFLLASLHINAILQETTIARRGKRLKSLKDGVGLGDAYGATLDRIRSQDGEKAKLAIATLTWICYAERPLLVDELCHALAVEIGETDFDPDNAPSIGTLLGCCQGLITVDKEASTVRLIHITVREYLCAHPDLFNKPHATITEVCLTYLNSNQVKGLSPHPLPDHQDAPFLKYSSRYWGTHANRELTDHARILALDLLNQCQNHVSAISLLKQILSQRLIKLIGNSPLFSGLHCASFFGNAELAAALIDEKSCNINQRDGTNRVPLAWAAGMGHKMVVKILLERENIDSDHADVDDRTPLGRAALEGHEAVVELLLGREDVNPNHPDKNGRTPLGIAAFEGHEGVVKLLLGRGVVNPDNPDNKGSTPLCFAAYKGHGGVAKLLLERNDVDPNHPDKDGITPLACAAFQGDEAVVKLLLEREDVDPDRPDNGDGTPLFFAACEGHGGVAKLLLERNDVNPNHPNKDGGTPLALAAFQGHEAVVKLLLEREDVDPDRPDNEGSSPLCLAAYRGHRGIARLLLDRKDVDLNRPDEDGRTPLACAALNGHEGVVELLLGWENVDPNRPGENGRTPLGIAAFGGHEGVAKLLLGREDVDPDRPDNEGSTPLCLAAYNGHGGVAKLLLDRNDVDPNHPDENGRTPLGCAALEGHEGVVELLLERENINPNHPDKAGRTPLGIAAIEGCEVVAKLLLEREDIDPDRPDNGDNTPLMLAAYHGHEGVAKLLLDRNDVNPNRPDKYNQTPLGYAAMYGYKGVVGLLLGREGIDPDRRDQHGRTPLFYAAREKHEEVVKLLQAWNSIKCGDAQPPH